MFRINRLVAGTKALCCIKDGLSFMFVALLKSASNIFTVQAILPVEKERSITNSLSFDSERISDTPLILNVKGNEACATGSNL